MTETLPTITISQRATHRETYYIDVNGIAREFSPDSGSISPDSRDGNLAVFSAEKQAQIAALFPDGTTHISDQASTPAWLRKVLARGVRTENKIAYYLTLRLQGLEDTDMAFFYGAQREAATAWETHTHNTPDQKIELLAEIWNSRQPTEATEIPLSPPKDAEGNIADDDHFNALQAIANETISIQKAIGGTRLARTYTYINGQARDILIAPSVHRASEIATATGRALPRRLPNAEAKTAVVEAINFNVAYMAGCELRQSITIEQRHGSRDSRFIDEPLDVPTADQLEQAEEIYKRLIAGGATGADGVGLLSLNDITGSSSFVAQVQAETAEQGGE